MRTWIGTIAVVVTLGAWTFGAAADDWPRFSGPKDNGMSAETGIIDTFDEKGPEVLWERKMEPGFGGSAVFGGKIYVMDRVADATDVLYCLDLASGKEEWKEQYDAPGKFGHPGARSTPAVDKDVIVTVGPMGDVRCWDREKHTVLWGKDLLADWNEGKKTGMPMWAVAQSALIVGDWVILAPQNGKVGVGAYEKKTGKPVWESKSVGSMAYASPRKVTLDGVDQIVMLALDPGEMVRVTGLALKDGATLWEYKGGWKCKIPIATPTDLGDGRFFITAAYSAGCAMFKVKKDGDAWKVEQLYSDFDNSAYGKSEVKPNVQSWMHDAIYFNGHLYANSSTNGLGLVCLTPEGKLVWNSQKERRNDAPGNFDTGGPLLIVDGKIFILHGVTGELFLAKATTEGYKELAKAKVLDGQGAQVWATMTLSDGKLLVRDKHTLKCLNVKTKRLQS